jgi:predicted methyltransferase MtxX (methanogen marker protein 4)
MLGDYQGIAESTGPNVPAVPLWIDTRTGNPDPYVTRIGMAPALNFTAWQAARLSLGQINDPQSGGEAGDADRDGEDNLSEYRSGTEPNDPLSVFRTGRLLNISTRARVLTGENILIGGFIISGSDAKEVAIRAIGPSSAAAGVADPLNDPTLEIFNRDGSSIATNDNWRETQQAAIQNSGLAPTDDRESATIQTLPPGEYTAAVRGKNDSTGVALVEVFDLAPAANSQLANISTRSFVGTDENVMIGGFIVGAGQGSGGSGSVRVLVRGVGPSLGNAGITGALQDPELLLINQNGQIIAENDNWQQTQESEIRQTGAPPADEREPALVANLAQGNYTAIVRGKGATTGVALVEAYDLP